MAIRRRWQFDLRSMLIMIAVLSPFFAMWTHPDRSVRFYATVLLIPTIGGCVGYAAIGWAGVLAGICFAALIELAGAMFFFALWS